jgi:integrative and conjugative element protein (TIGR02256 family)
MGENNTNKNVDNVDSSDPGPQHAAGLASTEQMNGAPQAGKQAASEELRAEVMHRWHFRQLEAELWLPSGVLAEVQRLAGEALPSETGGTLAGQYVQDGRVAQVERGLGVRRGGRHSRTSFYRPPDALDGQLAEIYRASAGSTYYLGEWHSHPGGTPGPSPTDLRTMEELARSPLVATDTPILLILEGAVGTSPTLC